MTGLFVAIFALGIVAGLRALTAPAVLWLMRHGGIWAFVLAIFALVEYAGDLHPKAPARTRPPGLIARIASGAFVGWWLASHAGIPGIEGALVALAGVLVGTYGGLAVRMWSIARIGTVAPAILEDVVAIVLAIAAIARTPS
jgi:uncharacterized membrane protein